MSISEFILAFVGIILGLGVADLLLSFHRLLAAGTKVKWHWLTPAMAFHMLLVVVVFWWWSYEWYGDVQSLTIPQFAPHLLFLVLSFLMIAAALPDEVPPEGLDLKAFYFARAPHLWSLVSISLVLSLVLSVVRFLQEGRPAVIVYLLPVVVSCSLAILVIRSRREWLHGLAIFWIVGLTLVGHWHRAIS